MEKEEISRRIELIIEEDILERLDFYLSKAVNDISRTDIKKMIKDGYILVNGDIQKPKYLLKRDDKIVVNISKPEKPEILPENIELDIIYQDEDIAIIDKPQGMIVHPASGNYSNTLVNALLYNFETLSDLAGEIRPGIVHRLDKDTSGLMIIAKNNFSHKILSRNFKNRKVKREYLALVKGILENNDGVIDEPIGRDPKNRRRMAVVYKNSKPAITHYEVLERFDEYTLIRARLETGRTHQIRVHLSYIKHPIVGDLIYSENNKFNLSKQLLHSIKIGFYHPRSGEYMEFSREIPQRFIDIIEKLK